MRIDLLEYDTVRGVAEFRVALLSSATTLGQQVSDITFEHMLAEAGTTVHRIVPSFPAIPQIARRPQIVDLVEAFWLFMSLRSYLKRESVDSIVFATTTATLFQPKRRLVGSALRFDALACENRLGRHNVVARLLERRALRFIPILMPMSSSHAAELGRAPYLAMAASVLVMPPPLETVDLDDHCREVGRVLCYAGNPEKKGLDLAVRAWGNRTATGPASLVVAGIDPESAIGYLRHQGITPPGDIQFLGRLSKEEFGRQLRRADIFLAASRYEDFGMAQLEAMSSGALVVSVPSRGPFEARSILRAVDSRLLAREVDSGDLARSIDYALSLTRQERRTRVERCGALLAPYLRDAVLHRITTDLLPELRARTNRAA